MDRISITLVTDDNYFRYSLTTVKSVVLNTDSFIHCSILLKEEINDENMLLVQDLQDEFSNITIELINVDSKLVSNIQAKSYVSQAAFIKIFIPEILDKLERTIYLDGDIYVNHDIKRLWDVAFLNGKAISAVRDPLYIYDHAVIGLEKGQPAFNSGVMCLNLKKMRKNKDTQKLMEFVREKNHLTELNDQPAFNYVYKDQWTELPVYWNVLDTYFFKTIADLNWETQNNIINNPHIIHFSGPAKPWKYRCVHPFKFYFIDAYESVTKSKLILSEKNIISLLKKTRDYYLIKKVK